MDARPESESEGDREVEREKKRGSMVKKLSVALGRGLGEHLAVVVSSLR